MKAAIPTGASFHTYSRAESANARTEFMYISEMNWTKQTAHPKSVTGISKYFFPMFRLNAARKENDFVYHEKVPPLDTLPELRGASLVKGIPFDPTDPEVSGADIFGRLVPIEAHETSSLYR